MNPTRDEAAKIINNLAVNFSVEISEDLIDLWHNFFCRDGCTSAQAKKAFSIIICTQIGFEWGIPTYDEFMEFIYGSEQQKKKEAALIERKPDEDWEVWFKRKFIYYYLWDEWNKH